MNGNAQHYDLLVIGGGINGAGIAADAAGRGLDVLLCEAGDLGAATSSASSKLIHGGLRYLEHYEFGLVRKALAEREVLLAKAPHISWPLRFILPHSPDLRPRWMIRAGLLLYDHLARRKRIPGSTSLSLDGNVFRQAFRHGFAYWDGWVDDARLVVLNARDAANRGATVLTRTAVLSARPREGGWEVEIENRMTGARHMLVTKAIVNATGPWAAGVLRALLGNRPHDGPAAPELMLVKGSHIVVPRIPGLERDALILQNVDGRVVFVLPYEQSFSLIGTTDVPFAGDPREAHASEEEIRYLLDAVARYIQRPPAKEDVVHAFAGVRPLYDEEPGKSASAASRDYLIHKTSVAGAGVLLTVFGGKITTYRQLSETVVEQLRETFPHLPRPWTAGAPLPGGDLPAGDFPAFVDGLTQRYPGLGRELLTSLARRHGSLVTEVIGSASSVGDLGRHFGHDLYQREIEYLVANEWARTADDILWRRTKAGLHMTDAERSSLAAFMSRAKEPA